MFVFEDFVNFSMPFLSFFLFPFLSYFFWIIEYEINGLKLVIISGYLCIYYYHTPEILEEKLLSYISYLLIIWYEMPEKQVLKRLLFLDSEKKIEI